MKRQRSQAPADAFFVGQVAAARGGEVAAVFAAFAEGEVGLAGPPTNSLVASPWESTQGPRSTLTQGVAEQPGLDRLGLAVQAATRGQDHPGRDLAAVVAVAAVLAVQAAQPAHGVPSSPRASRSSS
jgi:hypothetical protein